MNVFLHSDQFEQYHYPPESPFRTERAGMTRRILEPMGLLSGANHSVCAAHPASRSAVERFHSSRYLDVMLAAEKGDLDTEGLFMGLGTHECPVFKGMVDYAMLACGHTLAGAEMILAGEAHTAFNPSGGYHHADPEHAAGFCYLNDVALACQRLAAAGKRVVFLDVDVHHGDGVQRAFYGRNDVMTISLHESGETLFPGTGTPDETGDGDGVGYSVNVPFPAGTYNDLYLMVFGQVAMPLIRSFDPDVIVLEVGMDALAGDPMAHLQLTNEALAEVTSMVMGLGKPVLATGGGGYHPRNTARGWALVWSVLCGDDHAGMEMGLGGVMLESVDWCAGLRDRGLRVEDSVKATVRPVVAAMVEQVQRLVFPHHGL